VSLPANSSKTTGEAVSEELNKSNDAAEQAAPAPPQDVVEGLTDQPVTPVSGDTPEAADPGAATAAVDREPVASEAAAEPPAASDDPANGAEGVAAEPEVVVDEDAAVDAEEDEEEDEYADDDMDVEPLELNLDEEEEQQEDVSKDWYILKVQSNREASIRDGLARRVQVAGLDRYFGDIIVPTEDVAEFKAGKKKIVKRKMYPGYIVVHMAINDDTWFLVRETPGIGDFTGAGGKPTPMLSHEVDRILKAMKPVQPGDAVVKTAIPFKSGDRVRIKEGTFENFEGEVEGIDEANGRVTVVINIFGRSTPAELEHWQIEAL
jgi:transcriptional antiterminator NusG